MGGMKGHVASLISLFGLREKLEKSDDCDNAVVT